MAQVSGEISPSVTAYLAAHGIDPAVATEVGVEFKETAIVYPGGRVRSLNGGPPMRQPSGQPLALWWPGGQPKAADAVLVAEGEADGLAALTALRDAPGDFRSHPVCSMPGTGFPTDRLVADLSEVGATTAYLAMDADPAGRAATSKATEALKAAGIDAIPVQLPEGSDLADCIAAQGAPGDWLASLLADAAAASEGEVEAAGEVLLGLLAQIEETLRRYTVLPGDAEADALVLWVAHTWAFDASAATPYLLVVSPEKQSGKTRLAEVLELVVRAPWRVTGASEAAIFRKIEQDRPTLILDEIDAVFASASERTEPIRALLNAGNRAGSVVARCVGDKGAVVADFNVFCPKALVGIDNGRIPDTISDRAVRIAMVRRKSSEGVARLRHRQATAEVEPVRERLAGWASVATELLVDADPAIPDPLPDRAADAWEPLLALADLAGGDWPARARAAAVELSVGVDEGESWGAQLLRAIKVAFADADRLATAELLSRINADDETPFGGWREGKGLDSRGLAKLLRPYGVRPRTIRLEDGASTPKGYHREQFGDAWERWVPTPAGAATSATSATRPATGTTQEPLEKADVADVADVAAISGGGGATPATAAEEQEIERLAAKHGVTP